MKKLLSERDWMNSCMLKKGGVSGIKTEGNLL
jgi:hypothetical protein